MAPESVSGRRTGLITYHGPQLLGGALCLDFVNTVDPRYGEKSKEFISSYADLVRWAFQASAVDETSAVQLLDESERSPVRSVRVWRQAIEFREDLNRLLAVVVEGEGDTADAQLTTVRRWMAEAWAARELAPLEHGFGLRWREMARPALERPVWPVALSAVELLTSESLGRVRRCPGDDGQCGWWFRDASRAGTRQWCSMRSCGNRAKVRSHRAKKVQAVRRAR